MNTYKEFTRKQMNMKKILTFFLSVLFVSCIVEETVAQKTYTLAYQKAFLLQRQQAINNQDDPEFLGQLIDVMKCDAGATAYGRHIAPVYLVAYLQVTAIGESIELGKNIYTVSSIDQGVFTLMPQDSSLSYYVRMTLREHAKLPSLSLGVVGSMMWTTYEEYLTIEKVCLKP